MRERHRSGSTDPAINPQRTREFIDGEVSRGMVGRTTFGQETEFYAMNHSCEILPEKPPNAPFAGDWRRTTAEIHVTLVWGYDTVAILDDYYDSEEATLRVGHLIAFSQVTDESPGHVLCDIDDHRRAERECLASGRVMRHRPWCFATRLQAVLRADDFHSFTVPVRRPSWFRHVLRVLQ